MKWKFWRSPIVNDELNDMQIKVLSKFIHHQQSVINKLTEQNMQLGAEVEVLREVVDDLKSINTDSVNKTLKIKNAIRKTSPFKKQRGIGNG